MLYTLLYFAASILLAAALGFVSFNFVFKKSFRVAFAASALVLFASWMFYYMVLDNYLTRHWGGSMIIKIPEGTRMIGMTWKDKSLWYQYYDPIKNECVFKENSPAGVVEGQVKTPNCNPIGISK